MKKVSICKAASLLIALSICQQSVLAVDMEAMMEVYAKGQPHAAAPQQSAIRVNVETQRRQLENELSGATRAGRLTGPQEQDIRTRLNYIGTLQNQYSADGSFSNTEASSLYGELVRTEQQLRTYLSSATAPSTTSSSSFRTSSGALRNVDRRIKELDSDLRAAVRSGRLTQAQETDIRTRINYIGTLQTNYLSDGVLSDADLSSLSGEADRTDKQLHYYMNNSTVTTPVASQLPFTTSSSLRAGSGAMRNIDRQTQDIDSELRSAVRSRRLTPEQETDIRTRVNYIGTQKSSLLADGVLSDADITSLNFLIESTAKQLHYYLTLRNGSSSVGSATIDARIAQLEPRLQAAIRANSLGWNDAQQARAEIDQIRQKHRATVHDGTLAPAEEQMLTAMLNNFDTQLAASTGSRSTHWSAFDPHDSTRNSWNERNKNKYIDVRQQNLKERIWTGLQSRKLSQKEADRLLQAFNRIEALEIQLKSDGRMTGNERKMLNSELDSLSVKLNRELNDHNVF
ncbi:MAG: hypothetical protein K2W95_23520 [Candidatus Obscuribacterales bacterium]|nr:hypothetical protein [Candidatus Obscuribacterales bacterium]